MLDFTVLPASLWTCEWALPLIETPVFFIQLLILEGRRSKQCPMVLGSWELASQPPGDQRSSPRLPSDVCVCYQASALGP